MIHSHRYCVLAFGMVRIWVMATFLLSNLPEVFTIFSWSNTQLLKDLCTYGPV